MARWVLGSRWVRRLAAGVACGVVVAAALALADRRWGPARAFHRAEVAWEGGEYRRAAALFQRTADRYPGHPLAAEALYRVGRVNYLFLRDVREAVHALRGVARSRDAGPWGREAQRLLGEIFEQRQDDCRQAIVEYQRFIQMDPAGEGNDAAQLAVARCSFVLREFDQARAEYETLLERYAESPLLAEALVGLGAAAAVTGRTELALRSYRRARTAAADPGLGAEASFGIAAALEASGDLAGALVEFETALATHPNPEIVARRIVLVRGRMEQQGPRTGGSHGGRGD